MYSELLNCIASASIVENEERLLRPISSFDNFSDHLRTNAVGPIITAQKLLHTGIPIRSIAFMSSDSGSATNFRDFEDGYAKAVMPSCQAMLNEACLSSFAAYAASKAALNQMLRVMFSL